MEGLQHPAALVEDVMGLEGAIVHVGFQLQKLGVVPAPACRPAGARGEAARDSLATGGQVKEFLELKKIYIFQKCWSQNLYEKKRKTTNSTLYDCSRVKPFCILDNFRNTNNVGWYIFFFI